MIYIELMMWNMEPTWMKQRKTQKPGQTWQTWQKRAQKSRQFITRTKDRLFDAICNNSIFSFTAAKRKGYMLSPCRICSNYSQHEKCVQVSVRLINDLSHLSGALGWLYFLKIKWHKKKKIAWQTQRPCFCRWLQDILCPSRFVFLHLFCDYFYVYLIFLKWGLGLNSISLRKITFLISHEINFECCLTEVKRISLSYLFSPITIPNSAA